MSVERLTKKAKLVSGSSDFFTFNHDGNSLKRHTVTSRRISPDEFGENEIILVVTRNFQNLRPKGRSHSVVVYHRQCFSFEPERFLG